MKKKMWRGKPKPTAPLIFMDEMASYAGPLRGAIAGSVMPLRRMVVTQAMVKANSGKRVIFFSQLHWEDTGEAVKKAPKKFLPAQVLRRIGDRHEI